MDRDDYGNDFITVSDEYGTEYALEHIATAEISGELYMAFFPADIDEDHEDYGLLILKVEEEDGEQVLTTVDDDRIEDIHEHFIQLVVGEEEEKEEEEEE